MWSSVSFRIAFENFKQNSYRKNTTLFQYLLTAISNIYRKLPPTEQYKNQRFVISRFYFFTLFVLNLAYLNQILKTLFEFKIFETYKLSPKL